MLVSPDVHVWPLTFTFLFLQIFHLTRSTAPPHIQRQFPNPHHHPSHPSFKSPYAVDVPSWMPLKCTRGSLPSTTVLVPNPVFIWITVGSFPTSLPAPLIYYMSLLEWSKMNWIQLFYCWTALKATFLPLTGLQRKLTNRPFRIWFSASSPGLVLPFASSLLL